MAKRKDWLPDRFHVGQTCVLVLNSTTGHERRNGGLVTILKQRAYGAWKCSDPESSRAPSVHEDWRYAVRADHCNYWMVTEEMLRRLYEGEKLSTWDKFAKVTGLDLAGACLVANPVQRRRKIAGREVRHG